MHSAKNVSIHVMAGMTVLWMIIQIFAQTVVAPPLEAAELTKVVLVEGPGFFTGTPTVFAAQKGIFKKHGLEVEFVTIARSTTALEAVRNRQADLAWAGSAAITRGLKGPTDVRIISQHMTKPFWILVSQPEVKSIAELKGKVLGASAEGNIEYVMLNQILEKNGLNQGEWQHIRMRVPQRWPALKNKQIAAAALVPPYNMLALTQGFNRLADFDQHLPLWMSGTSVARIDTIKTKPAMIKSFLRAVKEAIAIIQSDKETAIQFWMKRHKVSREAAALAYDKYAPNFKLAPIIEPVKKQWEFRAKELKIDNPPPVESIVDFRLLKEVLKE